MKNKSKIMKSSLAVLVASSISFPSTFALANTNDENFDSIKLEQEMTTTNTDIAINDEATMESAKKEIDKLEESTEAPSLLPGDFFYFAKIAIEKIQLAFTMDDAKEAKLLADYAAERLSEVEALFKDGKQDEAIEALNKAIEMIQQSEDHWSDDENADGEEDSNDETNTDTATGEKDDTKMEEIKDDNTTEVDSDEETVKEEENTDDADKEEKSDSMTDMEELMAQNILSLKANLEKVKNPKAKAALQKNIEKSYIKLAEKLAKLDEKVAKKSGQKESDESVKEDTESKEQDTTALETEESTQEMIDETTVEKTDDATSEDKEETVAPVNVQQHEEKKEVKTEWKAQHKEAKEEVKNSRKEAKEEAKESRHEKKEEKKQHPAPAKENGKHAENGKENSKGHHKE